MSILQDITTTVEGLSPLAAGWLSAVGGKPVIVPGTPDQLAAQYAAVTAQQQAATQAALLQNQPTVAGLINNPTVIVFGLIAVFLIFFLLLRK